MISIKKIRKALGHRRGYMEVSSWSINGKDTCNLVDKEETAELVDFYCLDRSLQVEPDATGLILLEVNLYEPSGDFVDTVDLYIFGGEAYTTLPDRFKDPLTRAVYTRRTK